MADGIIQINWVVFVCNCTEGCLSDFVEFALVAEYSFSEYRKPPWGKGKAGCFLNMSLYLRCFRGIGAVRLLVSSSPWPAGRFAYPLHLPQSHQHQSLFHYWFHGGLSVWSICRGMLTVGLGKTRLGGPRPDFITSCFFTRSVPVFSLKARKEGSVELFLVRGVNIVTHISHQAAEDSNCARWVEAGSVISDRLSHQPLVQPEEGSSSLCTHISEPNVKILRKTDEITLFI